MKKATLVILTAVMAAGLAGVQRMNLALVEARRDAGISQADPMINAPPMVVFTTVALGGFRGIIADILWMRSARLQQEGRFFELVQLADWITKLEPRFSDVWAYHAWNLAYNISDLFTDHEDRWRWVRHGVALLRDEGLRYNPGDAGLLTELGWLFQHKIGFTSDDAHMTYKKKWAEEMEKLFGSGRPDYDALPAETADRIRTEYKLDPARMQQLEQRYGPLDWRMPQAHAIYWASIARDEGRGHEVIVAERMIYQSMADAFSRGTFVIKEDGTFVTRPNFKLLPYVIDAFEYAIPVFGDIPGPRESFVNFLTGAALTLYLNGRDEQAERVLRKLVTIEPGVPAAIGLEDFVVLSFARPTPNNTDAMSEAVDRALEASRRARERGDERTARGYLRLAEAIGERADF